MNPQQQGPVRVEDIARQLNLILPALNVKFEYVIDIKDVDGTLYKVHRMLLDDVEKFKQSEPITDPDKLKQQLLDNKTARENQEAEESKVLIVLDKALAKVQKSNEETVEK